MINVLLLRNKIAIEGFYGEIALLTFENYLQIICIYPIYNVSKKMQSKASFFHKKISNFLNLNSICIYLRYKSLKLSTRTPVGNVSYLIRD